MTEASPVEHVLRVPGMGLCPRRGITKDNLSEQELPTELPLKITGRDGPGEILREVETTVFIVCRV